MGFFGDVVQMNVGQVLQNVPVPQHDFRGKTFVITGANTGLGFEAANHLYVTFSSRRRDVEPSNQCNSYRLGASRIVLACRDLAKGETARRKMLKGCRNKSFAGKIEVWQVDMSSFASVLSFGDRLKILERLDGLIANAGISTNIWSSCEGWESTLTVNVISTMLVAFLALPKLRETALVTQKPGHLCLTGSVVHIFAKSEALCVPGPILESLNDPSTADMADRYNLSKLLLLLCFRAFSEKLEKQDSVIVNYVNPGWCHTELFRTDDGGIGGRVGLRLIGRTSEEGSRTLVNAITQGVDSHGRYLSECRIKPESTFVRSEKGATVQEKLWKEMIGILEDVRPGITRL